MFDDGGELYGKWCMVAVGAAMVSSILIRDDMAEGCVAQKGAEHGEFRFGGSTLILLFDSRAVAWDQDLVSASRKPIETYVKAGTRIGRSRKVALAEQSEAASSSSSSSSSASSSARLVASPFPTPARVVRTATTDSARKEAALNDEGLIHDVPALCSNLTLLPLDRDTLRARGVPSHTSLSLRARKDAAQPVNADTSASSASSSPSCSSSPSASSASASAGLLSSYQRDASSPSPSPSPSPSDEDDPSSPRVQLSAPAVFHLVQYADDDAADEDEDENEDQANVSDNENEDDEDEEQKGAQDSGLIGAMEVDPSPPPQQNSGSSSASSDDAASSRPPRRRSREDATNEQESEAVDDAAVAAAAAAVIAESDQPKPKKKKRGSHK